MSIFVYTAVDRGGKEKYGRLDASNRENAIEMLRRDGLMAVSLEEQGNAGLNREISFGKGVKPRHMAVFCRQFVSIMQAGVPMKEALHMLMEQTENRRLQGAIAEVLTNIEKGNTLADSMRGQSEVFPSMLINMVEAGETSGNLEMAFERMAIQFEKETKLKSTIRKATIYPIILIIAAIAVIAIMLLYVIPIFINMFEDIDVAMPGITVAVMNASRWTAGHVPLILAIIVLIIVTYRAIYRSEQGRVAIDDLKLRMPLFGKLQVKTACARFARTTSTLLGAGIPMMDCLETVSKIAGNVHFEKALLDAREQVMKGIPLSEPLQASGLFPPMVYHMAGIGEETGNIEEMLEKLADYYEEEVEITTESVMAALEPIVIVFMAVIVGTLVIACIAPMGAMYEGLENL